MKEKGVLLTGAKGFLGIHILKALLLGSDKEVYCIVRGKLQTFKKEFIERYQYYFGDYDEYKDRIILINGDFSHSNLGMENISLNRLITKIDTVIHAGAYVKHFGKPEDFQMNNCVGTDNIARFSFENSKFLIYISSMAVSGKYCNDESNVFDERFLDEKEFNSNNAYIKSKIKSENIITSYMKKGMQGQIMRIGSLTGRYTDGVFQINQDDNAFYSRLKTIVLSGVIPKEIFEYKIEFTPVDCCAEAIIHLLLNPKKNLNVFHLYNGNYLDFKELTDMLGKMGHNIMALDVNSYLAYKNLACTFVDKKVIKVGFCLFLRNHFQRNNKIQQPISSYKTVTILEELGFTWPVVDVEYLEKIISGW